MLTARGCWLLVTAVLITALGIFLEVPALVQVGLALLFWIAVMGGRFYLEVHTIARRLQVVRRLRDDRGLVETLWAGRAAAVQVDISLCGRLGVAHAAVTDRLPFAVDYLDGPVTVSGSITAQRPLGLCYRVRARAPGRARFEGLRLRLADLQGFFYRDLFLSAALEYRILPVLADSQGRPATTKRHNLLPPPGIHRLRRPGSGSELLDLRDYRPGDPPRTIAWKVSARRDRLITKEFESEVPLRCTLFVDTSNSVRIGPPGQNALARLVEIAAAVAQANTGNRDLTGLCLFDDQEGTVVAPARGSGHLVQLLNLLADTAGLAPSTGQVRVPELLPVAYAFAQEVYPDLLRQHLNQVPFWQSWLAPRPAWTIRRPSLAEFLYGRFWLWLLFLIVLGGAVMALLTILTLELLQIKGDSSFWLLMALLLSGWLGLLLMLKQVPLLLPRQRRLEVWRKRLAALLSVHHGLAPGGLAALMEDDELMAAHLQRFLAEHQVPFALPLYDRLGRYQFAAQGKIDVLASELLRAVSKGHDNELFVLLADLLELAERLDPLLRAVRVALARHHQVVVLCPWPPGLPPPGAAETGPHLDRGPSRPTWLEQMVSQTTTLRFHQAFQEVRQTFARLGVPVISAASDESVPLILDRLDRLRLLGRRR
jgi:uncharacterized protein (DUF58 family)